MYLTSPSLRHVARWSLADGADADGMTQLLQSWAFLPAAVAFFSVLAHTGMWNTARILEDPSVPFFSFLYVCFLFSLGAHPRGPVRPPAKRPPLGREQRPFNARAVNGVSSHP